MKVIGHYNIQHIEKLIKVIVLDVKDTEANCSRTAGYLEKVTVAKVDCENVMDRLLADFSEFATFNFDLRNMNYPLWFWDKIFFYVTNKLNVRYFISQRPSDISSRIRYPIQNPDFRGIVSGEQAAATLHSQEVEANDDIEFKMLLLKVLQWRLVDIDDDQQVAEALGQCHTIQDFLNSTSQS